MKIVLVMRQKLSQACSVPMGRGVEIRNNTNLIGLRVLCSVGNDK